MKQIGDIISIKTFDQLMAEGLISTSKRTHEHDYITTDDLAWIISANDPYLGKTNVSIEQVDVADPQVPYKVLDNFWIPASFVCESTIVPEPETISSSSHCTYGSKFKDFIAYDKQVNGENSTIVYDWNKNKLGSLSLDEIRILASIISRALDYTFPHDISTSDIATIRRDIMDKCFL